MNKEIILKIIEVGLPLAFGFISGYWIQKLKNRPQLITHNCRVSKEDVYAYFGSDNKLSPPICPFLKKDEGVCMLPTDKAINKWIRVLHKDKCYLAQ